MDDSNNFLLELAVKASKIAEETLNKNNKEIRIINSSIGHDIKLSGDVISEKIIIDFLRSKTQNSILSEESKHSKGIASDCNNKYWVIDPIDGTLNFSRGIPLACISISIWENDKPILGVINDFNRKELFTGIVGVGAWLNEQPIYVSDISLMEKAVLATGFPSNTNYSTDSLLNFVAKVQNFKKVRLIGSAALSLAYVACGRFDAYMEKGIMFWDVAGGIAITAAAGGKYFLNKINNDFQYNVLVCNKNISNQIQGLL